MWRNRFLGGTMFSPLYAPDGAGGGDGGQRSGGSAGADGGAGGGAGGTGAQAGAGGSSAGASGAGGGGDAAAATLAGSGGAQTAVVTAPATFPADWRVQVAKQAGFEGGEKDLERYADPGALYKAHREIHTKISKGELRAPPAPLPANATDEQKTAWRTQNGLPDKPEAYVEKLALPNGVVLGEAEKPLVGDFAKMAFDKGWSQGQLNEAVGWWYEAAAAQEAQRTENDGKTRVAGEVALRGEWGADYAPNMNAVGAVLALMPDDLRTELLAARTPTGELVGNTVAFNKWAAGLGRELNPTATIVMPGTGDVGKAIGDEVKSIEGKMYDAHGKPNQEYWRDEKLQARYRELIDAQQKMAARGNRAAA